LPFMHFGLKPLPFAFRKSMETLQSKPEETAMIGDQLFMDTLGGNLVNLYTIYVKPLTPETFLPRIWMRQAEKWLLNKIL
ncbi:MAG: HAD hydrolase-like protein, partial [bacterium]